MNTATTKLQRSNKSNKLSANPMSNLYHDPLFASLDADAHLARIGGGNETEVYCTDARRYVVKVKHNQATSLAATLSQAATLRKAARRFATVMGQQHSIPSDFLIGQDGAGRIQLLVMQPFYAEAQPLFALDYDRLSRARRVQIARQLLHIIRRAVATYGKRGWMPDLYGRTSASRAERERLNHWYRLPWRLWSFLIQRNLLRAHNLMLHAAPDSRIILVDYDPVTRGKVYQLIYYHIRLWLFWRDLLLIGVMVLTGWVPGR